MEPPCCDCGRPLVKKFFRFGVTWFHCPACPQEAVVQHADGKESHARVLTGITSDGRRMPLDLSLERA